MNKNKKIILLIILITVIFVYSILYRNNNVVNNRYKKIDEISSIINGYGVNIHFTGSPFDIKLIKDGGFNFVRMDLSWPAVESSKNEYDFKNSGYDKLTQSLINNGIRPYYVLNFGNKLYEQGNSIITQNGREAFLKFVNQASLRYKNKGIVWEIWNEPNRKGWDVKPNYDDYTILVKSVSKIIKRNDPSGIVVAPSLSGVTNESIGWLTEVLNRGMLNYVDAISVHLYRYESPETVSKDYQFLRNLISKYTNKEVPIISGEWGYPIGKGWPELNFNENQQAIYAIRIFLVNELNHIPISIWYDWKNDGGDPNNSEHNYGLRQSNVIVPKLSSIAIKALTDVLSGYHFEKRIEMESPDDYVLLFKNKEDKVRIVCWSTSLPHVVKLPNYVYGDIKSMYGEHFGEIDKSNTKISISSSPIYILPK
ncbi:cellulase family glycosylhydrolase [Niallia sp. 03190]|uniref:cellulase family glycosylhydrolase n=1 Tax=Niallia sp. 03190 TaxID=3458061 RepID=UPI004044C109